ncbi:hypothetical protein QFZ48_004478 [Chitinophaga sp. W2I13]|uniref:hypothetical protein n=1 Tax=Chitinophaga sp. W2I13 TaxID=3373923 RepID=UPI003D20CE31
MSQFFCRQPQLTPAGSWDIPPQELLSQGSATHLHLSAIAVRISFIQRRIISSRASTITIDLHRPFNGVILDNHLRGNGALLHVLQIITSEDGAILANRRSSAADIMQVVPAITAKQKIAKTLTASTVPDQVHVNSAFTPCHPHSHRISHPIAT